jgi:small subunit ribosomal protein S8
MIVTDPIADLLTRIRNAQTAKHDGCVVPYSVIKQSIVQILKDEGYIADFEVVDNQGFRNINIRFKYGKKFERVITNLKRISKPGLRVYCGYQDLPRVLDGLGVAIISTSKGVMSDRSARKSKVGGEVLCYVW